MEAEWAAMEVLISVQDGKIVLEVNDGDSELELKFSHELAATIGEILLLKAAEIEYEISSAVERITRLG